MKKTLLAIAITSTMSATAFAAPGDAVPNSFSNGTPADADQVNANFTEIVNQISTLASSTGVVGADGVGIESITDNNDGTFTITLTDGNATTMTLPAGPAGTDGLNGTNGTNGINGTNGTDGINGTNGTNGVDGNDGVGISSVTDNLDGTFTITLTDTSSTTLTIPAGPAGSDGANGLDGTNGTNGVDGTDGVGISSITDDGAGNVTINLSDGSSTVHTVLTNPTYSYRDYSHTYNTKTFVAQDTNGAFTQEERTFDRSVAGQVSFLRHRTGGISDKMDTIVLDNSGPELRMIQFDRHATLDPNTVTESRTMTPGVLFRTETMEQGKTFGSDSLLSRDGTPSSGVLQTAALIAVNQAVTVPAGSYTGCIKITRHRAARHLGSTYDRINTFCPGLGLVRQLHTSFTSAGVTETVLKELSTCDSGACIQP